MPPLSDRPNPPGELPQKMLTVAKLLRRMKEPNVLPVPSIAIRSTGGSVSFDWAHRNVLIRTSLDIGGRSQHVVFHHALLDASGVRLIEGENPLRWMGIGDTYRLHVRWRDVEKIIDSIVQSLYRFRSAFDYITG